ncbi:MAG: NnrS family protein [Alphaproteobacteria bacterium]|nr:NnrS family protein [Alphaproteobacteria bacterium]
MTRVIESSRTPILFSEGFRFFFFAGPVFAVVAMLIWLGWLGIHAAGAVATYIPFSQPPQQWHAHEMIFGYGGAVLAGFLLTAVPNWTGAKASPATFVSSLAALWLTGRFAVLFSTELPAALVMIVDVAFIPVLGANILVNLLKRPKPQNMLFLVLLAMMTAGNAAVHLEWIGAASQTSTGGLRMGLLTLAAMIAVLGGRVTPGFTRNAMVRAGIETGLPSSRGWLDGIGISSAILLAPLAAIDPGDTILAVVAAIAGVSNASRLAGWRTIAVIDQPILWSLHLGFAMLAAGYGLLALHWFGLGFSEAAALHVIAIGAIGGMTIAVMSRATLGHTGRPLTAAKPIAGAYALVALAALVRSAGVVLAPQHYFTMMFLAGGLWIAAFLIFIAVYAPIVMSPRLEKPE